MSKQAWPDIAFCGRMGAGKDFAASQLVKHYGYTRLALADALKEEVAALHGISVEELNANKGKYRADLQRVGLLRREQDPAYWIKEWDYRRDQIEGPVVCTDTRFMNEAAAFWARRACLIRIETPEHIRLARLRSLYGYGALSPELLNHPSEQQIDRLPVHYLLSGCLPEEEYPQAITQIVAGFILFPQDGEAAHVSDRG